MIESTQIATMRYATEAAAPVNLYSTETASGLTLGQLVIAVCLKAAASYEAQSVNKMNMIAKIADLLEAGSKWIERIVTETASWTRAKAFIMESLGAAETELPANLKTYANRLQAASVIADKLGTIMQTQQQDMVEMQSYVSRRDTAFSSSSNIVRALGRSLGNVATAF